ncbi:hypothetical protein BKA70DRAFT_30007 [Coprinopsis sp. MPI-PUGE-AT-0042]|nr:hypothetical protein BKA70DRAFT_30007 [Coprinopsis sp. MPI-PUGE-AT-0042]
MGPISYKPSVTHHLAEAHKMMFTGGNVSLVLYGIAATTFSQCLQCYWKWRKTPAARANSRTLQLLYSCLLFACGTAFIIAHTWVLTVASLEYPLYPGGSFAWIMGHYGHPAIVLGNASLLTTGLVDGFMLYRCYVICTTATAIGRYVVSLPCLLYLASVATSVLLLIQISRPTESLFSNINLGLTSFAITACLNILITSLICGRLILHRMRMRRAFAGSHLPSMKEYTSINAILIESSALYTAFFLMFIVPFSMDYWHPVAKLFLPMLAQIQVISPLLVVLRIWRGVDFSTSHTEQVSHSINFASRIEMEEEGNGQSHHSVIDAQSTGGKQVT